MSYLRGLLAGCTLLIAQQGFAGGQAIGTDLIKILDGSQFNVIYQKSLSKSSAAVFGYAGTSGASQFEVGYKAYTGGMHSSPYFQLGGSLFTNNSDNDLALNLKVGYETSPARNFVFFGTVESQIMMGTSNVRYLPMLGAMFAF